MDPQTYEEIESGCQFSYANAIIYWSMKKYINKAQEVLKKPKIFFEKVVKEKGYKEAFSYYAILSIISTILTFIVGLILNPSILSKGDLNPVIVGSGLVVGYLFNLALTFVFTGILYLWIKLWKGKEDYQKTYLLFVYSRTPQLAIGWIPFVGIAGWLYSFYLLMIGTQKIHKISQKSSVIMYVVPLILFIVISIVAAYYTAKLLPTAGA